MRSSSLREDQPTGPGAEPPPPTPDNGLTESDAASKEYEGKRLRAEISCEALRPGLSSGILERCVLGSPTMNDETNRDPKHFASRAFLRTLGLILAGIGLLLTFIGMGSFFWSFGSFGPPRF